MGQLTNKVLDQIRGFYGQEVDDATINSIDRVIKDTMWLLVKKQGKKTAVSEPVIIKYLSTKDYNYYYFVFDAIRFVYNGINFYEIGCMYYNGKNEELAQKTYNAIIK